MDISEMIKHLEAMSPEDRSKLSEALQSFEAPPAPQDPKDQEIAALRAALEQEKASSAEASRQAALRAEAAKLTHIPGVNSDTLVEILAKDEDGTLAEIFGNVNAAMRASAAFASSGEGAGSPSGDAEDKIEQTAQAILRSGEAKNYAEAFYMATRRHPELYAQSREAAADARYGRDIG